LTPVFGSSREDTPASESAVTEGTNAESTADDAQPAEDEIYEGEEDEATIHSVRTKISKLVATDGKPEWKTMGVGLIKLKQHNETGVRRILHRDTASRRIILNCRLFKGLTVSQPGPRMITLAVIEDQKPSQYLVRTPTAEDATELKKHIEEQVAALDS